MERVCWYVRLRESDTEDAGARPAEAADNVADR